MNYVNFNNAGSSKSYNSVDKVICKYLQVEKKYGGYYAETLYKKKIDKFYTSLSKLIKCKENEISFLQSSTVAWNLFLNSIKISKKQNIVILDNEYGSNFIYFKKNFLNIRISQLKYDGSVCIKDLESKIDSNTVAICVCHIASQCGDIIEVEKIGGFIKKKYPEILFVLDACQSLGQVDIDVKRIKCDVLVGSGRKYLRGPRGTGFIYLNSKINISVCPQVLDLKNCRIEDNKIKIMKSKTFENFEYSPALKLGLTEAIKGINKQTIEKIQLDIKKKSNYFRNKLKNHKHIKFYENINFLSGIHTFNIKNINSSFIYKYLISKKILSSLINKATSQSYFEKKKIKSLNRISIHSYNTFNQIDYLIKCLIDLIKK